MKKVVNIFLIFVFFILLLGGLTKVFGAQNIEINITPNNTNYTSSDVMLVIDISSTVLFDSSSNQGVQILLGEESKNNWIDLGTGKNGIALKKSYNYIVKSNGKVSVRAIEYKKEDRTDLNVLATEVYNVNNIDKTIPVIENVDVDVTTNSININVVAKDSESGIAKYNCFCNEISYSKSSESPKFDITGLEPNRDYDIIITVEDKLGNKNSITKKVKTQVLENALENQNIETENINTTIDNTITSQKIPNVGSKTFFVKVIIISILFMIILTIFNKR